MISACLSDPLVETFLDAAKHMALTDSEILLCSYHGSNQDSWGSRECLKTRCSKASMTGIISGSFRNMDLPQPGRGNPDTSADVEDFGCHNKAFLSFKDLAGDEAAAWMSPCAKTLITTMHFTTMQ
jgi:hypothetical protein